MLENEKDIENFKTHLESLHPNLSFDLRSGKEGEYLDLWLMLKDGKIERKVFTKSPPVYLSPKSCHDPAVFNGIYKGVGHRIRMNSSTDEYFDEAVEKFSRAFAVSGYSYQKSKSELKKFKRRDPIEIIKIKSSSAKNTKSVKLPFSCK